MLSPGASQAQGALGPLFTPAQSRSAGLCVGFGHASCFVLCAEEPVSVLMLP